MRHPRSARPASQRGLTLVELIVFIVIIGVGLAGITLTYNTVVRHSPDPMLRKQALAIDDSLLREIVQQPFTNAPAQPDRPRAQYDNVLDYDNYHADNGGDIEGKNTLAGYVVDVKLVAEGLGGIPDSEVRRIEVSVSAPGGQETVQLKAWRTRYAPN